VPASRRRPCRARSSDQRTMHLQTPPAQDRNFVPLRGGEIGAPGRARPRSRAPALLAGAPRPPPVSSGWSARASGPSRTAGSTSGRRMRYCEIASTPWARGIARRVPEVQPPQPERRGTSRLLDAILQRTYRRREGAQFVANRMSESPGGPAIGSLRFARGMAEAGARWDAARDPRAREGRASRDIVRSARPERTEGDRHRSDRCPRSPHRL
jgi:hypothetical protein